MNLLSSENITKEYMARTFELAQEIENSPRSFVKKLNGYVLANMFFEPSTRTQHSFEAAMGKLGGCSINLNDNSSVKKGETLEDTAHTMMEYADVAVIRHAENGRVAMLAENSRIPVINAGDGSNEHPTQALIDTYVINKHKSGNNTLKILFTGDLFYSRTVNSLISTLKNWDHWKLEITFAGEPSDRLKEIATPIGYKVIAEEVIPGLLAKTDILYMTRPQLERHKNKAICTRFVLKDKLADKMLNDAIIMHPFPRTKELNADVDSNKRAKYWQQIKSGLFVRMAILYNSVM